jgi:hypothetical protein
MAVGQRGLDHFAAQSSDLVWDDRPRGKGEDKWPATDAAFESSCRESGVGAFFDAGVSELG